MQLEIPCKDVSISVRQPTSSAQPVGVPYRPRLKYRCYRKVAGVRLCLVGLLFVCSLPFALVGLLFRCVGVLLTRPTESLFKAVLMPEFVRLAYVHKLGALHPKLSRGKRPHSRPIRVDVRTARRQPVAIHTIAQLSDNLGYLIVNRADLRACLVDCGDAAACRQIIAGIANVHYANQPVKVEAILTTHHHWDHMGGNESFGVSQIFAGRFDRVRGATHFLSHGDRFEVAGIEFEAIHTPCHTQGSIVFRLLGENGRDCLFLGDTLFCGGCGAFFEGTQLQMRKAFATLMLTCHSESLLFPGHEYTEQILMDHFPLKAAQFAAEDPARFFSLCAALCRAHHLRSLPFPAPTVPVRLADEVAYNATFDPVVRCCILLKRCLLALRPASAPPPPELVVSTPDTAVPIAEPDRLRPKVAVDETGQIVVIEPPWIIDHSLTAAPFQTAWRDGTKLRHDRHPKLSPAELTDTLQVLTDSSDKFIPFHTLELAVTQTLDQELPPACPQDLEKLARLFTTRRPGKSGTVSGGGGGGGGGGTVSSGGGGTVASGGTVSGVSLAELVTFVSQQMLVFEDEKRPPMSGPLRVDETIEVHDFTACRICQGQPVRGGARQLELARTGTTYSSRRHGLTTIITAADSDLSFAGPSALRRIASFPANTLSPAVPLPHSDSRRLLLQCTPTPASARDDFFLAHRLVEGKSLLMFSGDFEVLDAQREKLSPKYLTMATLSSIAD